MSTSIFVGYLADARYRLATRRIPQSKWRGIACLAGEPEDIEAKSSSFASCGAADETLR